MTEAEKRLEGAVRWARRLRPWMADDLEQELRLEHWVASQRQPDPGKRTSETFPVIRAKQRLTNYLVKTAGRHMVRGEWRYPTFESFEEDADGDE